MRSTILGLLAAFLVAPVSSMGWAHHNTQSEFGAFTSGTTYVEGIIESVQWGNPHIMLQIEITGGDLPLGEKWRVSSHPAQVQEEYEIYKSDFAVGDSLKLHAWIHLRGLPMMWPRAMQVNDGPMRSNLRFADMSDIAKGIYATRGIDAPPHLNGAPPGRAGQETVDRLNALGYLDSEGLMIWPLP